MSENVKIFGCALLFNGNLEATIDVLLKGNLGMQGITTRFTNNNLKFAKNSFFDSAKSGIYLIERYRTNEKYLLAETQFIGGTHSGFFQFTSIGPSIEYCIDLQGRAQGIYKYFFGDFVEDHNENVLNVVTPTLFEYYKSLFS